MRIMEKERMENVLSFLKTKNGDGKEGKHICRGENGERKTCGGGFFCGVGKDLEKEII